MSLKAGDSIGLQVVLHASSGALSNADALPTATLVRNGVDDAAVVTVTNVSTGLYKATLTLPAGVSGQFLQVRANATVGGVADAKTFLLDSGDSKRVGDLNDSAYAGGAVASVTAPVTASSVTDKTGYSLSTTERDAIVNDIFDLANSIETGESFRQLLRQIRAVLIGVTQESSGTWTGKRKDGSTVALTIVHDGAGSRTSSITGNV